MAKHIYKLILISFLLMTALVMPLFLPTGIAIYIRLVLILLIIIESLELFSNVFIKNKTNKIVSSAGAFLISFFVIVMLLEAVFMFVPRSHGFDFTLGSKLWFSRYWNPINSFGYRDAEPSKGDSAIIFTGDSFTEGHGMKNVDNRFSNVVKDELHKKGAKYSVVNIGKNGLDSKNEYDLMKAYIDATKIKPKVVVLQYYGNDIEQVAFKNGLNFSGSVPYADVPKILKPFIKGSYLFNFIYYAFPKQEASPYIDFLTHAYKNNDILLKHEEDLKLFIDYANENGVKLVVVVFPFLQDIELSNTLYVNSIVHFFEANNISTVNVSTLVKNIPVIERVVNANDGHASIKVNRMVAEEIIKRISGSN